jgi:hypothetical protein
MKPIRWILAGIGVGAAIAFLLLYEVDITFPDPWPQSEGDRQQIAGGIGVRLERTRVDPTLDQALWIAIRNRTHAIGFSR